MKFIAVQIAKILKEFEQGKLVEGFIHVSFKEEVLNSYNNYFKPEQKLSLLFIYETLVTEKLIVEKAPNNGKEYPRFMAT